MEGTEEMHSIIVFCIGFGLGFWLGVILVAVFIASHDEEN